MWILMRSNDLLYVLGAFLSGPAPLHSSPLPGGITCKSDHANEEGDGADDVSKWQAAA